MFLGDLYRTYCREGHANEPTPRQLLKILVYGYMNHLYSSQEIAAACLRDINFMWLLEGAKAPHYSAIARFRTLHFGLLKKLKEYTKKLHICGTRNGYSKTDHDAIFMRMKEGAMGNGQIKAGYNLQHGVGSEYISWLPLEPQQRIPTRAIMGKNT